MRKSKGVYIILFNTVLLMVVEIVAHYKSHAVSILGEVFHMMGDLMTVGVSLGASYIVTQYPGGPSYPFGLVRLEVLATGLCLLLIWGPSVYLVKLSISRYFTPVPLEKNILLLTAGFSLIINIINFIISISMKKECRRDMSISSIYVHALSDLMQCMGLFISGIALYFDPSLIFVDLIAACFSTIICFYGSMDLAREVGRMFMDASAVNVNSVHESLLKIKNVETVTDIKIWDASRRSRIAMVKVGIADGSSQKEALLSCKEVLRAIYAVNISNVEIS